MTERKYTYFVSDVHLGLAFKDPADRERRFVEFLRGIPADTTEALYMLGDIWDFWYEYRDVVPKGYVRVFGELMRLQDAGVKLYFFPGNHDMWCFSYFEELGIKVLRQPCFVEIAGKSFCLGHGDGLGKGMYAYKCMHALFAWRPAQVLFSTIHPRLAFALARGWSSTKRKSRRHRYHFKGESEPLYRYVDNIAASRSVDYFIFGHYHCPVDMPVAHGGRLLIMDDWLDCSTWLVFDGEDVRPARA